MMSTEGRSKQNAFIELIKWFMWEPPAEHTRALDSLLELLAKGHSFPIYSTVGKTRPQWRPSYYLFFFPQVSPSPHFEEAVCESPVLVLEYLKDILSDSKEHSSPEVADTKGEEQNTLRMVEQGNAWLPGKYLPFALDSHPWEKPKITQNQTQYCIR